MLPARRHLEGKAFKDAIEEDLPQSALFVQLLGKLPGKRPPEIPQGYTRLQIERAGAADLPTLQWRDPALVIDEEIPEEHRTLLEAETVFSEPLETFKQRVVRAAWPPKRSPSPPSDQLSPAPVVFINVERRDRALAEEIFRFESPEGREEADAFVSLILAAAKQREQPVYGVITMRSDFIGDCARFPGLPEAVNDAQVLTPRLTREQSRQAIEGPARVFGGSVEPALVNRLLNDMGTDPDQLPLMQHALMRMWTRGGRRRNRPRPGRSATELTSSSS